VWFDFRGNCGTVLSQTKGLAAAGRYLKDQAILDLCQRQLQWNLGLNPFSQSLMYGEGYDFAPQYSAMSGDMVGSLPVGIETHFDKDTPYWPPDNCYNYKEVWVHPSSRWLYILCDLYPERNETSQKPLPEMSCGRFSGPFFAGSEMAKKVRLCTHGKAPKTDPYLSTIRSAQG